MKILHVIRRLNPRDGGPPVVVMHLAAAQAEAGAQVHLLCHEDPATTSDIDQTLATIPGASGIIMHRVPCRGRIGELLDSRILGQFDRLIDGQEPVVVHLHGVWELMLVRLAARARRRGVPYILTPHGMLATYSLSQKRLKKRLALAVLQRRMLNGAHRLHTLNEDERRMLASLNLRPPVTIIPNGVNLDTLLPLPDPGAFHQAHPELGQAGFFLFLARLHHIKGLDILVDAFDCYVRNGGSMHLVIAGPDAGQRQNLIQQIHRLNLAQRTHLVGPLYGQDKLAALRDACALIAPSRQEAFSITITEAMACGLPVIISHSAHFPEVAQVGAGRVLPLDPAAFAKAMAELQADPAAAAEMSRAGAQLVRDRYTWPQVAAQMIETYHALLVPA